MLWGPGALDAVLRCTITISLPTFPHSISPVSLSATNNHFCGPVRVDLKDKLLCLVLVFIDLNVANRAFVGLLKLNSDNSLSVKATQLEHIKFVCFVDERGEESACLIRRKVA